MNGLGFLMEFLKAPRVVGALWPSCRALARSMVALAEVRNAGAVVELGPGTGVFSREILAALPAYVLAKYLELISNLQSLLI